MVELIAIAAGDAEAVVAPANGGAVAAFRSRLGDRVVEWFRPLPVVEATTTGNRLGLFPQVPFFGRIRDGVLRHDGRDIRLPHNMDGIAHAVHGHGFQRPWRVVGRGDDWVEMELEHGPDAWPWHYVARHRVTVGDDGALRLELRLANRSATAMPAGMGFHPYFRRTADASIRAHLAEMWESDPQLMPSRRVPADFRLADGVLVDELECDHVFVGWQGPAAIVVDGACLDISTQPPTRFAVVVSGGVRDFFVFEPVTHMTDAFNRAAAGEADTGTVLLSPGAEMALSMTLRPRL